MKARRYRKQFQWEAGMSRKRILEVRQWLQDRDNAHAAAVSAERDARIKVLEERIKELEGKHENEK